MPKKRPTVVTVMGVLNLVFGSLGVLSPLCLGCMILLITMMLNQPGIDKDPATRDMKEAFTSLPRDVPELVPFFVITIILGLIEATILLVSGIGLLKMRNWGRVGSIVYAVLAIITQIGALGYRFAFINPGMERWQENLARKMPGGQAPNMGMMGGNSTFNSIVELFTTLLGMTYAVILLVIMLRPNVRNAFLGRGEDDVPRRDEEQEFDPRDRDRWREPEGGSPEKGWRDE